MGFIADQMKKQKMLGTPIDVLSSSRREKKFHKFYATHSQWGNSNWGSPN